MIHAEQTGPLVLQVVNHLCDDLGKFGRLSSENFPQRVGVNDAVVVAKHVT
jgi:hypothetical protein